MSLALITMAVQPQGNNRADHQQRMLRTATISAKEPESRHCMALALGMRAPSPT